MNVIDWSLVVIAARSREKRKETKPVIYGYWFWFLVEIFFKNAQRNA